ncbi:MAG TPA: anhydro-N-acetylmuramic acid kinase [Gammaproteobacteria bacterium]|nr:anhydro-N-acetylmuramic acid kinase [Gammaproteobacteria bacterium]
MSDLFVGLMSGTSFDGIDAALVQFSGSKIELLATHLHPIPDSIKQQLLTLSQHQLHDLHQVCRLDIELGLVFADAVNTLLEKSKHSPQEIAAIGSHGQTLRHSPHQPYPYTLQIGDPHVLAVNTDISVVADFRRRDVALGGQGAPLAPLFHQAFMYSPHENRAIVNIGGFANATLLPIDLAIPIQGFDTGPGNVLIDGWVMDHFNQAYDKDGQLARQGEINQDLLSTLLADSFFQKRPPKSTGRDDFNSKWLKSRLAPCAHLSTYDVLATLTEFTARSITDAVKRYSMSNAIYICGGGAANTFLMERLQHHARSVIVAPTSVLGIDPNWLEAMLMAWLAQQRLLHHKLNLADITGSRASHLVGTIYS